MFPVKFKSKIPHIESYPLKAGEVSVALAGVPQAEFLHIVFSRYVRLEDRHRSTWPLIGLAHKRDDMSISTPNYALAEGWLDPHWEIRISPVPRFVRHTINALLLSEAFPILNAWLIEREALHGKYGRDWIHVLFDTASEKLLYERC